MSSRVGVNLLWLVPGVVGGSEEHTVRLLHALADLAPPDLEVTLFANARLGEAHADLAERFDVVTWPGDGTGKVGRVVAESTWLATQIRRRGIGLTHHAGGIIPFVVPGPTVVTVHDLQPLALPENFAPAKRWFARLTAPLSVRRTQQVVSLTRWVRDDVVARTGIDPVKTSIVPPVVPEAVDPGPEQRTAVRRTFDLEGRPFFVYPTITYPHKNHVQLVHAFAGVHRRHPDAVLVLTGGAGPREADVAAAVSRLGLTSAVRRTGRITRRQLDTLLWEAAALTFPSRYEGCGIPVIEAMARGCPVLASDATALPEVVGGGGLLIGPRDVDAWTHAMVGVLEDEGLRRVLADRGLARARSFRPELGATALASVFRRGLAA